MDNYLISLHPEWYEQILEGTKTEEFRSRAPKGCVPFAVLAHKTGTDNASLAFVVDSVRECETEWGGVAWHIKPGSVAEVGPFALHELVKSGTGRPIKSWPQMYARIEAADVSE